MRMLPLRPTAIALLGTIAGATPAIASKDLDVFGGSPMSDTRPTPDRAIATRSPEHSPSRSSVAFDDSLPVAIVLVKGGLPHGAFAVVEVRPRGLEHRFIIVPEGGLTDALIMRARGIMKVYAFKHPEDTGHVQFILFEDGRLETLSNTRGREIGSHVPLAEHSSGKNLATKEVLERAAAVDETDFPGFGRGRIVEYIGARR